MKHVCDNCKGLFESSEIGGMETNLHLRTEPGGVVPSGECPKCGALVYPENSGKVFIVVEGGNIQAVYAGARYLDVVVVDHDLDPKDGAEALGQNAVDADKIEQGVKDKTIHLVY